MSTTGAETPRERLLARQVSLLRHLTDPGAFDEGAPTPDLASMSEERLRLVGRMSLNKRLGKIRTALPRTFTYVPHVDGLSVMDFASHSPPYTITRYENAKQFVDYIRDLWNQRSMEPTFLPDLAAVEAAMVKVTSTIPELGSCTPNPGPAGVFRMARNVELLLCRHDVQVFFAGDAARKPPVERDVRLVVGAAPDSTPRISEISPKLHDLLCASEHWRPLDIPEVQTDREIPDLIRKLARMHIIEVSQ